MGTIENGYTLCEMECPVRLGNAPREGAPGATHTQASKQSGPHRGPHTTQAEIPMSRTPAATRRSCV